MKEWWFYTVLISFAAGIFVRSFFVISPEWVIGILLISGMCAVVWTLRHTQHVLVMSVVLLFLALGAFRMEMAGWSTNVGALDQHMQQITTMEGVVVREPEQRARTTHLYVRVDAPDATLLLFADRNADISYGDHINFTGELERPTVFETDFGRQFDYPGYLMARGVSHVMFYPDITVVANNEGNPVLASLLTFKHRFMDRIEQLIPEPQVGLSEGLLLGVKSALGDELEEAFRRTGIVHIVVLSGYNVMLVVVFVTTILSFFLSPRARLPFGLIAIAAFALMVGLSATVVRASIMAALILVARATGRSYAVMRALFFAGFIMLLINPNLLVNDIGFQLSFVATLGLILLSPHLEQIFVRVPSVAGTREFLVATIATQIFVLPLLLFQIGEFSLVSVVVNVLVLPMVPVAMFLTFITGMVGFVSTTLATPIAFLAHLSLSYILNVATWFAALPFAAYIVPPFPFGLTIIMYVALGYIVWRIETKRIIQEEAMNETVTLPLAGWTIEDEIDRRETAELSQRDNSADAPIFFR